MLYGVCIGCCLRVLADPFGEQSCAGERCTVDAVVTTYVGNCAIVDTVVIPVTVVTPYVGNCATVDAVTIPVVVEIVIDGAVVTPWDLIGNTIQYYYTVDITGDSLAVDRN